MGAHDWIYFNKTIDYQMQRTNFTDVIKSKKIQTKKYHEKLFSWRQDLNRKRSNYAFDNKFWLLNGPDRDVEFIYFFSVRWVCNKTN